MYLASRVSGNADRSLPGTWVVNAEGASESTVENVQEKERSDDVVIPITTSFPSLRLQMRCELVGVRATVKMGKHRGSETFSAKPNSS